MVEIYNFIYDMMHLCRIIKNSLHPSQIVPFAKLHHTEKGKRTSSIQQKTSLKILKTGHSLILIIPNSSRFPGFSLISKRERSHIPSATPPPQRFHLGESLRVGPEIGFQVDGLRRHAEIQAPLSQLTSAARARRGKDGKSWDGFLARQINQSWHYVTCCNRL